jgi:hypothetical protein
MAEDVRVESSGKHTVVGAFPGGLNVEQMPARIALALYAELIPSSAGEHMLHIKIAGPGEGSGIVSLRLSVMIADMSMAVYTPRMDVLVGEPGDIIVSLSHDAEEWVEVTRRPLSSAGLDINQHSAESHASPLH